MKFARLKGYAPIWIVGSRSDGLGFKGAGSNLGRLFRIEWPRRVGRAGGGADRQNRAPAAERCWELAGVGGSGDSERGLAWDLMQKRVLDLCNPPVRSE